LGSDGLTGGLVRREDAAPSFGGGTLGGAPLRGMAGGPSVPLRANSLRPNRGWLGKPQMDADGVAPRTGLPQGAAPAGRDIGEGRVGGRRLRRLHRLKTCATKNGNGLGRRHVAKPFGPPPRPPRRPRGSCPTDRDGFLRFGRNDRRRVGQWVWFDTGRGWAYNPGAGRGRSCGRLPAPGA